MLGPGAVKSVIMGIDTLVNYKRGSLSLLVPFYTGVMFIVVHCTQVAGADNLPGPGALPAGIDTDP